MIHYERGWTVRQAVVYPGEDDFWVAECPVLAGCINQERQAKQEAIVNIEQASEGYIAALEEDDRPVLDEDSKSQG